MTKTLYDKIWTSHNVKDLADGEALIYIDRHFLHEVTSPQAFSGIMRRGATIRRPDLTLGISDHTVPTRADRVDGSGFLDATRTQYDTFRQNCAATGVRHIAMNDPTQGIVHVVGPELGYTLPGLTIVCGDSHTSTHGAFGAFALGIGTSEVEQVLATQTLALKRSKQMRVVFDGELRPGVFPKDMILALIGEIGADGGNGFVFEYDGSAIRSMGMEGRMTICNMSIEAGARAGLVSPDDTTFTFLAGRENAPKGNAWDCAVVDWRALATDNDASFDREVHVDVDNLAPQVTWGTSPEQVVPVTGIVPPPRPNRHAFDRDALDYMGLKSGTALRDVPIDTVFVGSCTNSRIEDIREVARVARSGKVAPHVRAMVVPGSMAVHRLAEREGLHEILLSAGFEWRTSGCSMCAAHNGDTLRNSERCVSTSNRNFRNRQGPGGRTHLASPATAAASALTGRIADPRDLL